MMLSPTLHYGSYLLSAGLQDGFRGLALGWHILLAEFSLSLLMVVGREVLLFFINSLGFELFNRTKVAKGPPFRGVVRTAIILEGVAGLETFTMPRPNLLPSSSYSYTASFTP